MLKTKSFLVSVRVPCEVDSVTDATAIKAGLKKGDKIIAINNDSTPYLHLVKKALKKNINSAVAITVLRGKDTIKFNTPVSETGTIGFANKSDTDYFKFEEKHYGFFSAFPAGIHRAGDTFDSYIKQMKMMFTVKEAHKQIGGFGTIASAYSTTWNWQRFWEFTAFLSIVLAIMNVLPIPALDGGHVMFLLYEVITGRKPNEKVMEWAQYAGMILLLALLLYANGNDVVRWFSK
jgi:regulator of sigma E protease